MGVADLVGVVIAIMEQGSSGEEGSFSGSEGEEEEEEEDMTMEGGDLASQVNLTQQQTFNRSASDIKNMDIHICVHACVCAGK